MKMSNKNRGEQVLAGMISPQASPPNRDGEGPANGGGSPKRQFFSAFDQQDEVLEDDIAEDCLPQTDQKKRKLTVEQVQFLEASFECENKLDPDRKTLIAKQLGLPQRQVAVWFQNRRARSKNKQLEKDHLVLKAECDALAKENIKLKDEIVRLTKLLHSRDTSKLVVKGGGTSESWGEGVEILQPEPGSKTKKQVGVKIEVEVSTDHEVLGSSSSSKCEVVDFIAMSPPSLKLDDSIQLSSDDQELQFMSSVCNPCMLAQQLTLSGCLTDDNYNLFFAQWDETSLFPWWERLQSSLPVNLNASIDPITFPAAPP